jgi:ribonuclease P protein component
MTRKKGAGIRWIKGSRDIRSLRRTGRFSRGTFIFAWASPVSGESLDLPLVGVVSGRGFGKAIERNLARRRVRGCIMDMRHLLEPGIGYLVECRPGAQSADYQLLVNELGEILAGYSSCEKKKSGSGGGR